MALPKARTLPPECRVSGRETKEPCSPVGVSGFKKVSSERVCTGWGLGLRTAEGGGESGALGEELRGERGGRHALCMPCSLFPQKHNRRKPLTSPRKQIWLTGLMMISKSGKCESGPAKLFALSASHSSLTRTQARLGFVISCAPHCLLLLPVGKMISFNS